MILRRYEPLIGARYAQFNERTVRIKDFGAACVAVHHPKFGSGIPPGPNSHPTFRSPIRFRLLQAQSALPTVCDSFATYRPITHSPASTICRCIASAMILSLQHLLM
jgi:hypothetical protein